MAARSRTTGVDVDQLRLQLEHPSTSRSPASKSPSCCLQQSRRCVGVSNGGVTALREARR
ncbi:MAG: hypothetical protein INR71_08100 [Terriglobus roseus]|nr:hypothetical protein [Terriglobus roseus]